ncbi:hypothetical protein HPB52_021023 [Rhipicephalus sanguineus]|uniref:MADF domain-containing protein n=1 Tax=Rhipicephalus sanguineus TaxID=34632 RepID=A0A9D4T331_RHISA|nr:hypothetical protein HPB52_021023 [Rhipicephalus sanguineus]
MATWSDDATLYFLSLVEQFPTLWDTGRDDYSNNPKKQALWERVAKEMTAKYPAHGPYNVEVLKTLFANKRRTFRKEKKKVSDTKSGQALAECYSGKWKFYRAMKFLEGINQPAHRFVSGARSAQGMVDELGDLSNADEVPDSVCEIQQESTQPRDEAAEARSSVTEVVRNALVSAVAALALDGQCTPSTSTEALDGNQADSGTCSPTTNAEVTESTEVRNGNVSSAFNATDLETADVDEAVQTDECSFLPTYPRCSTPPTDYAPQLDVSAASDLATDEDDEIVQHADVNEAEHSTFVVSEASIPEEPVNVDLVSEAKYLVFGSCLMVLFERCCSCQAVCRVQKEIDGSLLRATCPLQHVWLWESQPLLKGKAVGNILLAA